MEKKPPYKPLNIKERDMLYAFYEKHNGNMSAIILDKECIIKAYNQVRYYVDLYNFHERLIENRQKRAEKVMSQLTDGKVKAIENALRILEPSHSLVFNKSGLQIFDIDGNALIVERLPYYKEIKTAWEIIKTELGEPTTIQKSDVKHSGEIGQPIISGAEDDKLATEEYLKKLEANRIKRSLEKAKQDHEIA